MVLVVEGDSFAVDSTIFDGLEKYAKPKEVLFISNFKETENGKILRKETLQAN